MTLALNSPARHLLLWSDGEPASAFLEGFAGNALRGCDPSRCSELRQGEGDLGDRLAAAWEQAEARGHGRLLMLGSDAPDLPAGLLDEALAALEAGAEVVLGPAQDGGVWCIGLGAAHPGYFGDLPWSEARTGEALWNRARSMGLKTERVSPWFDCDEPEDLRALADRLRRSEDGAKMTRAWLAHNPLA